MFHNNQRSVSAHQFQSRDQWLRSAARWLDYDFVRLIRWSADLLVKRGGNLDNIGAGVFRSTEED